MKLIIEPDDGVSPILSAIKNAKKSVDIAIFRFDRKDAALFSYFDSVPTAEVVA